MIERLAGREAFGLAEAPSATVALWAGGGEESISGGPPALPGVCLPGPAPLASSGLQKLHGSSVSRGRKLSFAAGEGTVFRLRPEGPG